MLYFFLINLIAFLLLIKVIFFSGQVSRAIAAPAPLHPATTELISSFEEKGYALVPSGEVKRSSFDTQGSLFVMGGDNIQVFEFASKNDAEKNAGIFLYNLTHTKHNDPWQDYIHVYTKDNLIIYYMGKQKTFLETFQELNLVPAPLLTTKPS